MMAQRRHSIRSPMPLLLMTPGVADIDMHFSSKNMQIKYFSI